MSVADLYRAVVLEHGKRPRNRAPLPDPTHAAEGDNPLCGDAVRVELVQRDETIASVGFSGESCVLATASASLMTERVLDREVGEARALAAAMTRLCADGSGDAAVLGELHAFADVHRHPVRVACALLPWRTLLRALGD